jgi:peptidoglycan/LPS O-acetylase OafA/YrhL
VRYHGLDALRAAMMLLGLVLHSAASYTQVPMREAWPLQDAYTSIVFDLLLFFIHLFRMPVFFLVAGFFAALLYERGGAMAFARNRASRVALPLALFWVTMIPLLIVGLGYAARQTGTPLPWVETRELPIVRRPILAHFWFLYDLLIFYAAALSGVPLARALPAIARHRIEAAFRWLTTKLWAPLVLGAITAASLLPMPTPGLETAAVLAPPLRVLAAYGLFFAFGWLLYRQRDLLDLFARRWAATLGAGAAASLVYLLVLLARASFEPAAWHLAGVMLAGLAIWLLIFGVLGLSLRHANQPRALVRYFADASYWMYLTHLVPVTWTAALLNRAPLHAAAKFGIVLAVTTAVTVATYHLFVRSTALGGLLNGRRYPRSLPRSATVASAPAFDV